MTFSRSPPLSLHAVSVVFSCPESSQRETRRKKIIKMHSEKLRREKALAWMESAKRCKFCPHVSNDMEEAANHFWSHSDGFQFEKSNKCPLCNLEYLNYFVHFYNRHAFKCEFCLEEGSFTKHTPCRLLMRNDSGRYLKNKILYFALKEKTAFC